MNMQVGDIGTQIIFDTGEDLTSATVHTLRYQKPNGEKGDWPGTIAGESLTFTTTATSDLDVAGEWLIQAYLEIGTWKGHSEMSKFTVNPNIG